MTESENELCTYIQPSNLTSHMYCIYVPVLVLVFTTARNWLHGPHKFGGEPERGNKTGGTVGCGDTSLVSLAAWPPQCSRGTRLWACKTHEMREVGYSYE